MQITNYTGSYIMSKDQLEKAKEARTPEEIMAALDERRKEAFRDEVDYVRDAAGVVSEASEYILGMDILGGDVSRKPLTEEELVKMDEVIAGLEQNMKDNPTKTFELEEAYIVRAEEHRKYIDDLEVGPSDQELNYLKHLQMIVDHLHDHNFQKLEEEVSLDELYPGQEEKLSGQEEKFEYVNPGNDPNYKPVKETPVVLTAEEKARKAAKAEKMAQYGKPNPLKRREDPRLLAMRKKRAEKEIMADLERKKEEITKKIHKQIEEEAKQSEIDKLQAKLEVQKAKLEAEAKEAAKLAVKAMGTPPLSITNFSQADKDKEAAKLQQEAAVKAAGKVAAQEAAKVGGDKMKAQEAKLQQEAAVKKAGKVAATEAAKVGVARMETQEAKLEAAKLEQEAKAKEDVRKSPTSVADRRAAFTRQGNNPMQDVKSKGPVVLETGTLTVKQRMAMLKESQGRQ
jgi:hypothetical protein